MKTQRIIFVGERDPTKKAHQGIEASFARYHREFGSPLRYDWVPTSTITAESVGGIFRDAAGVWCTPGSPYESTSGALLAVKYARIEKRAFLGTCGGFQHGLMEFAQNVLLHAADHQEIMPTAKDPLIVKLSCSLIGMTGKVFVTAPELFSSVLSAKDSTEEFNCNYGLNSDLEGIFRQSDLVFVAHDEFGQVRAFRLRHHPFFVGTLFQPERRALVASLHPVVHAFFKAACGI